jgi:hypothetical protein
MPSSGIHILDDLTEHTPGSWLEELFVRDTNTAEVLTIGSREI